MSRFAAKFAASWKSPSLVAPSPKNVQAICLSLPVLRRPGEARRVEHLGADRNRDRGDVVLAGDGVAALVAHPVEEDVLHRKAPIEEAAVLAIAGNEPVVLVEGVRRAERGGFLSHVLGIGAHAAGALELEGDLVEVTADRHVLVQLDEILIGDQVLAELGVELAMLVEDREMLDLSREDGLQRHRELAVRASGERAAGLPDAPYPLQSRRIAERLG
jgi:hypothetical protein